MLTTLLHAPRFRPLWRALLATLLLVVCWLAFTPDPPTLEMDNGDKLQHLLAFSCLAGCTTLTMAPGRWQALWAAAAMLAYGVFIELVQLTIPGRSGEWQDVVADAVGIGIGLLLVSAARRTWGPRVR